jgi:hypothetical protein
MKPLLKMHKKEGNKFSASRMRDVIEEQEPEQDDEVSTCAPPADEVMQEPVSPVQQSEDEVSHFPLQNSNNTVLLDSKEEEEMEASDEIEVPCCELKMKKQHMLKTPESSKYLHKKKQ